jgi:hypothetical protein
MKDWNMDGVQLQQKLNEWTCGLAVAPNQSGTRDEDVQKEFALKALYKRSDLGGIMNQVELNFFFRRYKNGSLPEVTGSFNSVRLEKCSRR